ncbi:hypothetical protein [Fredinandcohnia onubensis]|uniref:hypothetical protein n=1 Tax=Fredinandcohnia onubensis TaxID=1571209 RepID=UPI000C0BED44|nr:hypothetical protein [Fredinandcohnia onubensis]
MKGSFINPESGKRVSGGAAQLMIIKHNGGWEKHHQKYTEKVTETILKDFENDFRRSGIRRVK